PGRVIPSLEPESVWQPQKRSDIRSTFVDVFDMVVGEGMDIAVIAPSGQPPSAHVIRAWVPDALHGVAIEHARGHDNELVRSRGRVGDAQARAERSLLNIHLSQRR